MFSELLARPAGVLVEATADLSAVAVWELPAAPSAAAAAAAAAAADGGSDADASPAARLFAAIDAASPDRATHWYLAFVASRGGGGGSALIRHRLAALAALGAPACLFTGSPENLSYYARFGLRQAGRVDVDGGHGSDAGGASAWWFVTA